LSVPAGGLERDERCDPSG